MWFFRLIVAALLLLIVNTSQSAVTVEIFGDDAYPPYAFINDGKPDGIYTRILEQAFSYMEDYDVTITLVPWRRGLASLEAGEVFALFPPYKYSTDIRPYISPYSAPILDEQVVVFCTEEVMRHPRESWPSDYLGLTIGINSGFKLGGNAFWEAVEAGRIQLIEADSNRQNVLMLSLQRIDCYLNDKLSILWEINRLKSLDIWRGSEPTESSFVSSESGYIGYTNRNEEAFPFKNHFVELFNTVINRMKDTGEIQQIIDNFLSE